jgi:SSS family transporter
MNFLDWLVIIVYVVGLIVLSRYLGKHQKNTEDYYLAGQKLAWWTIGLSTMATQLGAISFVSAPAFVALKPNGGLIWLGYEFAVPAAMVFIMIFIIPVIHRAKVVSAYEYLERRFDSTTRTLISFIFQISRALATGVSIYAVGIVLSAVLNLPLIPTIILIGIVTIIYDMLGGIKAVIYSDVIQMFILTLGIIICGWTAYFLAGGWENVVSTISPERLKIVDIRSHGFGDGNDFSFWALVIGGFFLYASYYGCDQSQIQRELSAKSVDDAKKSLLFNGLMRFPMVVAYCTMGLFIGAFAAQNVEFMNLIPEDKVDYMVPIFVLNYLPNGIIGFIVIAILAAFMSSLDSAINSLSAATMRDIYQKYIKPQADDKHYFLWSKVLTVFWGVVCTVFAFVVGAISETLIEAINKVGSVFYGSVLAAFVLAILVKRATATATKIGVVSGVLVNLVLWFGFPRVSWLWWNATGFISALVVAYLWSLYISN